MKKSSKCIYLISLAVGGCVFQHHNLFMSETASHLLMEMECFLFLLLILLLWPAVLIDVGSVCREFMIYSIASRLEHLFVPALDSTCFLSHSFFFVASPNLFAFYPLAVEI